MPILDALLEGFDRGERRDRHGRWVDGPRYGSEPHQRLPTRADSAAMRGAAGGPRYGSEPHQRLPAAGIGREGAAARSRGARSLTTEHADTRDKLTNLPQGQTYGLHGPQGQVGHVLRTASGYEVHGPSNMKVHKTPSAAAGEAMRIQRRAASSREQADRMKRQYAAGREVAGMNARQAKRAEQELERAHALRAKKGLPDARPSTLYPGLMASMLEGFAAAEPMDPFAAHDFTMGDTVRVSVGGGASSVIGKVMRPHGEPPTHAVIAPDGGGAHVLAPVGQVKLNTPAQHAAAEKRAERQEQKRMQDEATAKWMATKPPGAKAPAAAGKPVRKGVLEALLEFNVAEPRDSEGRWRDYFSHAGDHLARISDLTPSERKPDLARSAGVAAQRMADAKAGKMSKRGPLTVQPDKNGKLVVHDGKSTLEAAKQLGLTHVPVTIERHGGFKIGDVVSHERGSRGAGGHGPVVMTKQPGLSTVVGLQRNGNLRLRHPETGTTHDVHHSNATKIGPLHPDYRGKAVQDSIRIQREQLAAEKAARAKGTAREAQQAGAARLSNVKRDDARAAQIAAAKRLREGERVGVGLLVEAFAAPPTPPASETPAQSQRRAVGQVAAAKASLAAGWNASKHPRAAAGRFGYTTGGKRATRSSSAGSRTLGVGSNGSLVTSIQRQLHIAQDGKYGQQTRAAVTQFQRQHGLQVDGVVGAQTIAALRGHPNARSIRPGPIGSKVARVHPAVRRKRTNTPVNRYAGGLVV